MRVLALDLATTTGWAVGEGGFILASGTLSLASPAPDAFSRHAGMGDKLADRLADLLTEHAPTVACVETATGSPKGEAARVMFGLRMVAGVVLRRRELLVDEANASTWQPWARRNLDWVKGDEEDARAIALWWMAVRQPLVVEAA